MEFLSKLIKDQISSVFVHLKVWICAASNIFFYIEDKYIRVYEREVQHFNERD